MASDDDAPRTLELVDRTLSASNADEPPRTVESLERTDSKSEDDEPPGTLALGDRTNPTSNNDAPKTTEPLPSKDEPTTEPLEHPPETMPGPPATRENPFESLSGELFIMVATLLSPLDRACLAFATRHTHAMMRIALNLNPNSDRFSFLCRLEKSGIWPLEFLCSICEKFHLPQGSRGPDEERSRKCVRHGTAYLLSPQSPYLPDQVHFDFVAAVMRSHRYNLGAYSLDHFASRHVYTNETVKIVSNTSARVYQGQLLLKTETFVFAGKTTEALHHVEEARAALEETEFWYICQHVDWDQPWSFVFHPDAPLLQKPRGEVSTHARTGPFSPRYDLDMAALHKCLWTHPRNCWLTCVAASRVQSSLDITWSCMRCETDYKASAGCLEGESSREKYVVFTSWKNLGQGLDRHDERWRSHMPSYLDQSFHLKAAFFEAARGFEGTAEGAEFEYCPVLPRSG